MKIIYPDSISTISADTFDSDYPAANLLDDHPQKMWKAGTGETTAVLTVVTDGADISGLFLGGTNATSGSIAVKDTSEVTTFETVTLASTWSRYFVKFSTTYSVPLHIIITLTASAEVYAGVIRAGAFISTPDPKYGLKQQREDYSIKKELSNGGLYVFNRNKPVTYDLSFLMLHATYDLIDDLFYINGSLPLAFLLSDNIGLDNQWSGFFHITNPPSSSYDSPDLTNCSIALKEAV